jgi:hypothetical protein
VDEKKQEDKTLDQSLNIGTEIRLYEGCIKHVKIGSIKLIREIRQLMKDIRYKFSFCIGRGEVVLAGETINFDAYENTYRIAFDKVLFEGLSNEEFEDIDESGIKELDTLLDRFL